MTVPVQCLPPAAGVRYAVLWPSVLSEMNGARQERCLKIAVRTRTVCFRSSSAAYYSEAASAGGWRQLTGACVASNVCWASTAYSAILTGCAQIEQHSRRLLSLPGQRGTRLWLQGLPGVADSRLLQAVPVCQTKLVWDLCCGMQCTGCAVTDSVTLCRKHLTVRESKISFAQPAQHIESFNTRCVQPVWCMPS
jgi:hypothetical protein